MKPRYRFLLLLLLLPFAGRPQAVLDSVMTAVKSANPELNTSRLQMEAEMKAARTGIFLPNPEIQFDYLWAEPGLAGNRTDFGISQSFSFPTVYVHQAGQAGLIRTGATLKYLRKEREMMLKTKSTWIRIVGLNRELALLRHRMGFSAEIAGQSKTQLNAGEIDIIRYHHAQMELINLKNEMVQTETERMQLLNELILLAGGKSIEVADTVFPVVRPGTLEEIIASWSSGPMARQKENEILVMQKEKSIAVSRWLPEFTAGYYSEKVPGLSYRGIQTGMSIPLWQNGNLVKSAGLQVKTAEAGLEQVRMEELSRITSLYAKRQLLAERVQEMRTALLPVGDSRLLRKALDSGQISISEFYYEASVFYTAWSGLVHAETELALTDAELEYAGGR